MREVPQLAGSGHVRDQLLDVAAHYEELAVISERQAQELYFADISD